MDVQVTSRPSLNLLAEILQINGLNMEIYVCKRQFYDILRWVIGTHKKTNSVALSPQANYTDCATTTCR
jgi:hypothetical protein